MGLTGYVTCFPFGGIMGKDICIIDDNQEYLEASSQLLQENGYKVTTINDPHYALQFLQHNKPHLIILDLMMPNMDGFTLLRQIKDDIHLRNIPVLIVSGKVFLPEKKRAASMGAVDFLTKPVKGKDLLSKITEYC